MKKGLRRGLLFGETFQSLFERGPDEEGIETPILGWLHLVPPFERGPDEEGIETPAALDQGV